MVRLRHKMIEKSGLRIKAFSLLISAVILVSMMLLGGCSRSNKSKANSATNSKLTILATPLIEPVMKDINKSFLAQHPEAELDFQVLSLTQSAPRAKKGNLQGDIFIAPEGTVFQETCFASDRKCDWARSTIIIAVPRGNPKHVQTLADLARPEIARIAIPEASHDTIADTFASTARSAGCWNAIQPKLSRVGNPISAAQNVSDGRADAAITLLPIVLKQPVGRDLSIAILLHDPQDLQTQSVVFAAVPLKTAVSPLVQAYLDSLRSPEAQAALGQACFTPVEQAEPTQAKYYLDVPCGAGLKPAMDELGDIYFNRAGVRVDFTYAGAGMLLSQLITTRRGDLYIPGEAYYVDQARKKGFVAVDHTLCYMTPVIGVRKGNPSKIAGLPDLTRPGLRIAVGDPKAIAIGPMTQRIFARAGIDSTVRPNITMEGACVPELANALATHSADAGVIWDVMAVQNVKNIDAVTIDPRYNEASEVLVARLSCSKKQAAASKLMDFLTSEEAAAVLHKYGYSTTRPAGLRLAPREKVGGK
jgi:molybdate transport system substrate-binding protein